MGAIIQALLRAPPPPEVPEGDGRAPEPARNDPDHADAGRRGGLAWGIFAVLKILFLFGGVWILFTRGLVDPIPLVVGYGVLPLGIAASALWPSLRPQ
jgi:hypothetical protein